MTRKSNSEKGDALAKPESTPRRGLRQLAGSLVKPVPLEPPRVDPNIANLGAIERAGETLRYSVLRGEHWLSPSGMLREYLRLNLRLAIYLGIPAVILTPIITLLLSSAVSWSATLVEIARNLVLIPTWLGTALLVITALGFLKRLLFGR